MRFWGLNTNYENSRNSIIQQRDNALQENTNQQNQIRTTGDAGIADIENSYASQLAQYLQQQQQYERQRADSLNDIQSQRAYEQQLQAQQTAAKAYSVSQMQKSLSR